MGKTSVIYASIYALHRFRVDCFNCVVANAHVMMMWMCDDNESYAFSTMMGRPFPVIVRYEQCSALLFNFIETRPMVPRTTNAALLRSRLHSERTFRTFLVNAAAPTRYRVCMCQVWAIDMNAEAGLCLCPHLRSEYVRPCHNVWCLFKVVHALANTAPNTYE